MRSKIRGVDRVLFRRFNGGKFSGSVSVRTRSSNAIELLSLIPTLCSTVGSTGAMVVSRLSRDVRSRLIERLIHCFSSRSAGKRLVFAARRAYLLGRSFLHASRT